MKCSKKVIWRERIEDIEALQCLGNTVPVDVTHPEARNFFGTSYGKTTGAKESAPSGWMKRNQNFLFTILIITVTTKVLFYEVAIDIQYCMQKLSLMDNWLAVRKCPSI